MGKTTKTTKLLATCIAERKLLYGCVSERKSGRGRERVWVRCLLSFSHSSLWTWLRRLVAFIILIVSFFVCASNALPLLLLYLIFVNFCDELQRTADWSGVSRRGRIASVATWRKVKCSCQLLVTVASSRCCAAKLSLSLLHTHTNAHGQGQDIVTLKGR